MTDHKNFEVIIIGGSYAGLSAAMALGHSLRSVLIGGFLAFKIKITIENEIRFLGRSL